MKKRMMSLLLSATVLMSSLAACSGGTPNNSKAGSEKGSTKVEVKGSSEQNTRVSDTGKKYEGTIRWLNYKPEVADQMNEVAEAYTQETGIKVKIETAASNTYEPTLTARMDSSDAPSIFVVDSIKMLNTWKENCLDLSETELNSWTQNDTYKMTGEGKVYGISYALEAWGIIVNKGITDAYFKSPNKKTEYKSLDDLYKFDALKAVVEDMQSMKDELGISGVFGSTSLKAGDDWRYQTHLMNQPLYWEWGGTDNIDLNGEIPEFSFKYAENYKNILDLYLNNSVTEKSLVGTKTVDDSMAEFALGKCVMIQNGDWAWSTIQNTDGKKIKDEDVCFIPISTGVDGEDKMGLNIGAAQYMCVNSQLSKEDQDAAIAFLEWLFSSETGKKLVSQKLQFVTPFSTMQDAEYTNPLFASENAIAASGKMPYIWANTLIPSEKWKEDFGSSLLQYAQGQKEWEEVVKEAVSEWASERELANANAA